MLHIFKTWCYIFLSLTMVVTLFHVNSLLIEFNKQSHEIVVPSARDESTRICLNLSLEDIDENDNALSDDELEAGIEKK